MDIRATLYFIVFRRDFMRAAVQCCMYVNIKTCTKSWCQLGVRVRIWRSRGRARDLHVESNIEDSIQMHVQSVHPRLDCTYSIAVRTGLHSVLRWDSNKSLHLKADH